jgi:hypothetical protein
METLVEYFKFKQIDAKSNIKASPNKNKVKENKIIINSSTLLAIDDNLTFYTGIDTSALNNTNFDLNAENSENIQTIFNPLIHEKDSVYYVTCLFTKHKQSNIICIIANSTCCDVCCVACDSENKWFNWILDEGSNIVLPFDSDGNDLCPLGMWLDYSFTEYLPGYVADAPLIPPSPILVVETREGLFRYLCLHLKVDDNDPLYFGKMGM